MVQCFDFEKDVMAGQWYRAKNSEGISAIERQNALTPKLRFSQNWYPWNQENEPNVTIVVGYAYLVIILRPEQADCMNSTLSNEPSNVYHGFSQNKEFGVDALCLSTADLDTYIKFLLSVSDPGTDAISFLTFLHFDLFTVDKHSKFQPPIYLFIFFFWGGGG